MNKKYREQKSIMCCIKDQHQNLRSYRSQKHNDSLKYLYDEVVHHKFHLHSHHSKYNSFRRDFIQMLNQHNNRILELEIKFIQNKKQSNQQLQQLKKELLINLNNNHYNQPYINLPQSPFAQNSLSPSLNYKNQQIHLRLQKLPHLNQQINTRRQQDQLGLRTSAKNKITELKSPQQYSKHKQRVTSRALSRKSQNKNIVNHLLDHKELDNPYKINVINKKNNNLDNMRKKYRLMIRKVFFVVSFVVFYKAIYQQSLRVKKQLVKNLNQFCEQISNEQKYETMKNMQNSIFLLLNKEEKNQLDDLWDKDLQKFELEQKIQSYFHIFNTIIQEIQKICENLNQRFVQFLALCTNYHTFYPNNLLFMFEIKRIRFSKDGYGIIRPQIAKMIITIFFIIRIIVYDIINQSWHLFNSIEQPTNLIKFKIKVTISYFHKIVIDIYQGLPCNNSYKMLKTPIIPMKVLGNTFKFSNDFLIANTFKPCLFSIFENYMDGTMHKKILQRLNNITDKVYYKVKQKIIIKNLQHKKKVILRQQNINFTF